MSITFQILPPARTIVRTTANVQSLQKMASVATVLELDMSDTNAAVRLKRVYRSISLLTLTITACYSLA